MENSPEQTQSQETQTQEAQPQEPSRPEWLPEKFKSAEDLSKSYSELEKRFGGFTGAPENYEFSDGVDGKDPRINALVELARETNMNNDTLNRLLELDRTTQEQNLEAYKEEQMKLLGDNATKRIKDIDEWGKANIPQEMQEAFRNMATSADAVNVIESIIKASKPQQLASDEVTPTSKTITKDELDAMQFAKDEHGNRLISINPEKRREFEEAYRAYLAQK